MWCGCTPAAMWWWMITAGFRYSFSALKDRHTAVEVNYTDPQNGWQTSTELVEDPEAILLRTQPAEDGRVRLYQSVVRAQRRAVGDKDRTAGNADGGFHARQGCVTHPVTLLKSVIMTMPDPDRRTCPVH